MWAQILNILNGICLMILPWQFELNKTAANNLHIVGPLIAMFAIIALSECTRNIRWWNVPLGSWLIISPFFIEYNSTTAVIINILMGALVVALSLVKGKIHNQFGGGWAALVKSEMKGEVKN